MVENILRKYEKERFNLISILQEIQSLNGYISEDAIKLISEYLDISESEIYGVATFYTQFRFTKPGKHKIKICVGTACHVKNSKQLIDETKKELGIAPGQTTSDNKFSLETIACFGSCALAPVVVIDDNVFGKMTPQKLRKIFEDFK